MEEELHVLFLPLMAHGHTIPIIDMAKLFSSRALKTSIISTSAFSQPIQASGCHVTFIPIKFPSPASGLPPHILSLDQVTSPHLIPYFFKALDLLQEQVDKIIQELRPNCLVSDMLFSWTAASAAKFRIPRFVFHVTCFFSISATDQIRRHKPFNTHSSESETYIIPNFPGGMKFIKSQVPAFDLAESGSDMANWMQKILESDGKSDGILVNSFYELEPDYADYYRKVLGRKAWSLGPLSLNSTGDRAIRGNKSAIDAQECLSWLDSKKPESVVYVCFGSLVGLSSAQQQEIAAGLECCSFIWVIGKQDRVCAEFEERTKNRGLVIRGWAPQLVILNHPAVGAFVTHCGWNSVLEGICAGVPMVTWPFFVDQFYNERLLTEVLKIGVSIGKNKWQLNGEAVETVAEAVEIVMVGELGLEMRKRAKAYKEMATKAVQQGGSSYNNLNDLIQYIRNHS